MTEITVVKKNPVRPLPFALALVSAPLTIGIPAALFLWSGAAANLDTNAVVVIPFICALATVLGAPTYLLFGGPAFWMALRNGFPTAFAGFLANLASLPFVVIYSLVLQGHGEVWTLPSMFLTFGSVFSLLWGWIFGAIYHRFKGEQAYA